MLNLEYSTFPVLTTKRLTLRRLVKTDAPLLHQLRADEGVNRYIDRPPSIGIDAALAFIEMIDRNNQLQNSMYWVITLTGDDNLIGTICLWNFDNQNSTVELGYELTPAQQGQGLMAEAVTEVINFSFNQLNADAITAYPSADNSRSVGVLKRFGFVLDDTLQTDAHTEVDNMLHYILKR